MYEIVSFLINGGKNKFPCHVKEKLTPKVQDKPQFFVRYQTLANVTCDNNKKKKKEKNRNIGLHLISTWFPVALEGIEQPSDDYAVVNKTPIDFQKFENDTTIEGMEKGFSLSLSLSLQNNLSSTKDNA